MDKGIQSNIGTSAFFTDIVKNTIFNGVKMTKLNRGYGDVLEGISKKASAVLNEMYADLEKNAPTLHLLSSIMRQNINSLADNVHAVAIFKHGFLHKSAGDIKRKLTALTSSSSKTPKTSKPGLSANKGVNGGWRRECAAYFYVC